MLRAFFLVLSVSWSRAVSMDRIWRAHTTTAKVVLKRAVRDIATVGLETNRGIASLFEWEHERAYKYERLGAHSYWDDPRIHNFGNVGWRGLAHALVVPVATHAIDRFAYSGIDVRNVIHETILQQDAEVVDLCCGVGFSSSSSPLRTRLAHLAGLSHLATQPARPVIGVDTSRQMLNIARLRRPEVRFVQGNAESWGESGSCDVATVMYAMHEMPGGARRRVIQNALRLARQSVLIVDIWPGFEPSPMMLSGEPYVLDFLQNIDSDVSAAIEVDGRRWRLQKSDLVEEHVTMWRIDAIEPSEAAEDE